MNSSIPKDAKLAYKGGRFEVWSWEQKLYDGTTAIFERLKRPNSVNVIPITEDGKILLTEQEQPGQPPFIGTPGGIIDEGEEALEAAKRELREETGYDAKEYILWDVLQPHTSLEWTIYTYIAKGCHKGGEMQPDAGEKIRPFTVTFDEFLDIVTDDRFRDKEIALRVLKARVNPEKLTELKNKLMP